MADRSPVAATVVTGPIREIIPTDSSGSFAVAPSSVLPGATVNRLVPSRFSSRLSSPWLDEEMPTTETMAAMPMAIPSADRTTRVGRVRSPARPTRTTSRGPSRAGDSTALM